MTGNLRILKCGVGEKLRSVGLMVSKKSITWSPAANEHPTYN